jgi:HEAT repeat protein
MDKAELMQRMRRALQPEEEVKGAGGPAGLTDGERADLVKAEGKDAEARRTAMGNLLATEKPAVRAAVIELLNRTNDAEVKCEAIRCLGRAMVVDARASIEAHLEHKDALVRSYAAVGLERLGQKESVQPLLKRAKSERDLTARKNVCRALGACAGPAADEEAAAALLKTVSGDKQNMIRKHAALSLRAFSSDAASALVRPKLEQLAARTKDATVRSGIVYTLAFIGKVETTEPILKEILEDQHDEYRKNFLRQALRLLRGESGDFGRSAWFLFWEDRDDPARSDDIPADAQGGPGGGGGR